ALRNGADLVVALRLGEGSLSSARLASAMRTVRSRVRRGHELETALQEEVPTFDDLTLDLIRTGRMSGRLAKMLIFTSKIQEEETRQRAKRIAAIAEPLAILAISGVVGTIVISIVLAITSVYDFAL
ncbi:MAG: type II secretion system F family protein, partial [Litorimonas sp.]